MYMDDRNELVKHLFILFAVVFQSIKRYLRLLKICSFVNYVTLYVTFV